MFHSSSITGCKKFTYNCKNIALAGHAVCVAYSKTKKALLIELHWKKIEINCNFFWIANCLAFKK